ncbi:hypothetical protein KoPa4_00110 [Pseudomonas phage vB_PpuM-KoPa-4]|uniref:Uncharacterized protein n=1 Tax=Pseudomonas phage vB_PpuM-KoPa-4 TaxID=3132618 RepID=A0AAX4MYZ2_9CAUD
MNVMAKAHELARTVVANAPGKGVYAYTLRHALIHFHKEYKAMSKYADQITKTEAFIKELEAADTQGFIIVIGELRVCVNAELGHATNVLKAPVYMNIEDAVYWASRIQNGKGDKGEVVGKFSQLKYEIEQQKELIKTLKSF